MGGRRYRHLLSSWCLAIRGVTPRWLPAGPFGQGLQALGNWAARQIIQSDNSSPSPMRSSAPGRIRRDWSIRDRGPPIVPGNPTEWRGRAGSLPVEGRFGPGLGAAATSIPPSPHRLRRTMVERRNRRCKGSWTGTPTSQSPAPVPEYVNHQARVRKWRTAAGRTYTVPSPASSERRCRSRASRTTPRATCGTRSGCAVKRPTRPHDLQVASPPVPGAR